MENEIAESLQSLADGTIGYLSVLGLLYRLFDMLRSNRNEQTSNLLVFQMKENIKTYYVDSTFNISLLCKMLYVSESYASRLFKKHEGMTLKSYLAQTRLSAVQKVLLQENCTIKEAAKQCGYNDYEHFLKKFKLYTGCTAKDWKKNMLAQNADNK